MSLILFLQNENKLSAQLLQVLRYAAGQGDIERIHSLDRLKARLQRPFINVGVVVFYVESPSDVGDILYLIDGLGELRVALIFPDERSDLMEKIHLLRPNLVTAIEHDFKHLGVTLKRMSEFFRMVHLSMLDKYEEAK